MQWTAKNLWVKKYVWNFQVNDRGVQKSDFPVILIIRIGVGAEARALDDGAQVRDGLMIVEVQMHFGPQHKMKSMI